MANPFDFSSGAVLTAAQLNSIGKRGDVSWSPSANWSGSFLTSSFSRVNDIIIIQAGYQLDATPSGTFEISNIPVSGYTTLSGVSGTGCAVDTSADNVHAVCPRAKSGGSLIDFTTNAENDFATVIQGKPFTFASGDSIRFVMVYQV